MRGGCAGRHRRDLTHAAPSVRFDPVTEGELPGDGAERYGLRAATSPPQIAEKPADVATSQKSPVPGRRALAFQEFRDEVEIEAVQYAQQPEATAAPS